MCTSIWAHNIVNRCMVANMSNYSDTRKKLCCCWRVLKEKKLVIFSRNFQELKLHFSFGGELKCPPPPPPGYTRKNLLSDQKNPQHFDFFRRYRARHFPFSRRLRRRNKSAAKRSEANAQPWTLSCLPKHGANASS